MVTPTDTHAVVLKFKFKNDKIVFKIKLPTTIKELITNIKRTYVCLKYPSMEPIVDGLLPMIDDHRILNDLTLVDIYGNNQIVSCNYAQFDTIDLSAFCKELIEKNNIRLSIITGDESLLDEKHYSGGN